MAERRAIKPMNKNEYMLKLQDMFRNPEEMLELLRSKWDGANDAG